jgi:hypothetical protein
MEHLNHIIKILSECAENAPDKRVGNNLHYKMHDIVMSAFAVFWFQSPSWLNFQDQMHTEEGLSNLKSLFGCNTVPTENHVRNILDGISPDHFKPVFEAIHNDLIKNNIYEQFMVGKNRILISVDGTEYFNSNKIHCNHCNHKYHKSKDSFEYNHSVVGITICSPNTTNILPLAPVFVDNNLALEQKKQDCEHNAFKRFLNEDYQKYDYLSPIFLLDALYADNNIINLIKKHENANFIITAKEGKNKTAFKFVNGCNLSTKTIIHKVNSNTTELWTFKWLNGIPLTNSIDTNRVNYLSLTRYKLPNKEQLQKLTEKLKIKSKFKTINDELKPLIYNFFTDIEVNSHNVDSLISYGRTRWRLENGYNSLKKRGYHFEHNFGHGHNTLSSVLATLIIIAFLLHTSASLIDELYKKGLQNFSGKKYFYQELKYLTKFFIFKDLSELFLTIANQKVPSRFFDSS